MNNEFLDKKKKNPFINISRENSFSDYSKNIFNIQNLKFNFENNNFSISNLKSKIQKSHSSSCLRKYKVLSFNNKIITTKNNLQLIKPKICFKNENYQTIKIIRTNTSFSDNDKNDSQKKNKITISYCKNEDEFTNTYHPKNINNITENHQYISPKKKFVSNYNNIHVNKLNNKSKAYISIQNYPRKNLMNLFEKINVNDEEGKANNKKSNNKNLHNNIITSLKSEFGLDKKELYQKNDKNRKIFNYNNISSKKDKINNKKKYNVKLFKNISSLKKKIMRENFNNIFKYRKLNNHFNNKNILSKNSKNNNIKIKKSKSFDFTRIKKIIERYFKYF